MLQNKKNFPNRHRTFQPKNHDYRKHPSDANINNGFILSLNSTHISNNTKFTLITLLLLFSCATTALAQCDPPKGSYLDTCKVTGSTYYSTDPNLKNVAMCKFDLSCGNLKGKPVHTNVYVQKSMTGCLKFFENCNGQPVVREGNERICTTQDSAERESRYKAEL